MFSVFPPSISIPNDCYFHSLASHVFLFWSGFWRICLYYLVKPGKEWGWWALQGLAFPFFTTFRLLCTNRATDALKHSHSLGLFFVPKTDRLCGRFIGSGGRVLASAAKGQGHGRARLFFFGGKRGVQRGQRSSLVLFTTRTHPITRGKPATNFSFFCQDIREGHAFGTRA